VRTPEKGQPDISEPERDRKGRNRDHPGAAAGTRCGVTDAEETHAQKHEQDSQGHAAKATEKARLQSLVEPRGVAQLVEHRSPKPVVAGSSPVAPAQSHRDDSWGHSAGWPLRTRSHPGRLGILSGMPGEHEQSFTAESRVGRYWLLNCVGFRVEGARGHTGTVEEVGLGPDGVEVLAVRRRGVLGGVVLVPAERVAWVHPWDDTIELASHSRRARDQKQRPGGTQLDMRAQELGRQLKPIAISAAVAIDKSVRYGAAAVHDGALVVLRLLAAAGTALLGLTVLARRHAPGARRAAKSVASALLLIASAYVSEARRFLHEEKQAIRAWRESRRGRVEEPADDGPLTRAGADDIDARRREPVRR
jgi:hypothetical protein